MPRLRGLRDVGGLDLPEKRVLGELLAAGDAVHVLAPSGGKLAQQPLRQHRRDLPAVVRCGRSRAHRAYLLLHQLGKRCERVRANRSFQERVGTGKHDRLRIGTGERDVEFRKLAIANRERARYAGQREIDGAANTGLAIPGYETGRQRPNEDPRKQLVGGDRQMRGAVVTIQSGELYAALAAACNQLDLGAEHEQRGSQIARERGMAMPTLRRDVADLAAALQAVAVGAAPPFALVVEHAAGVEAKIAANRRDAAMAGAGDRTRRFSDRRVMAGGAIPDRELRQCHPGAQRERGVGEDDAREFAHRTEVDEHRGTIDSATQPRHQVGSSGEQLCPRLGDEQRRGLGNARRMLEIELGHAFHAHLPERPDCASAPTLARSRSLRLLAWIASSTRSGEAGSSVRRMPIASQIALVSAGGKLSSAASLASFAPNGPSGSLLSTSLTSIGGDSTIVGIR